jgi:hypothetical protein
MALRCRWPWLRWSTQPRPWSLVPVEDDCDALALFKAGARIKLGDGRRARFWTGGWLPDGRSMLESLPILFSFARDSGVSVAVALENRRWVRDIVRGLSTRAISQYLRLWELAENVKLEAGQSDQAMPAPPLSRNQRRQQPANSLCG